jgi:hypothetical protein
VLENEDDAVVVDEIRILVVEIGTTRRVNRLFLCGVYKKV